jgi:hypothetical protein
VQMLGIPGLLALATLAVACETPPPHAPLAPPTTAPAKAAATEPARRRPDLGTLTKIAAAIDPNCNNTCCVVDPAWTSNVGPTLERADAEAARASVDALLASPSSDPRVVTVALRVLRRARDEQDIPRFVGFIDDERPGTPLPNQSYEPAKHYCANILSHVPTTPAREARYVLHELLGVRFQAEVKDVRGWLAAHPDLDTFEVWVARAGRKPQPTERLASLRAKDPVLFTKVMLACAYNGAGCGMSAVELGDLVKETFGPKLLLALLEDTTKVPEWTSTSGGNKVLRNMMYAGARVFGPEHVAALDKLFDSGHFGRSVYQADLAVLMSRIDPVRAKGYWERAVAIGVSDEGTEVVLREAAKRDPAGTEKLLSAWFFAEPNYQGEPTNTQITDAIMRGLAEGDAQVGAPVFARLLTKATVTERSRSAASALHKAATHVGCKGLPEPTALLLADFQHIPTAEERVADQTSVDAAILALFKAARQCAADLPH